MKKSIFLVAIFMLTSCIGGEESGVEPLFSVEMAADDGKADSLQNIQMTFHLGQIYQLANGAPISSTDDLTGGFIGWTHVYDNGMQPAGYRGDPESDFVVIADGLFLRPGTETVPLCVEDIPPPGCLSSMSECPEQPSTPPVYALSVLYMPEGGSLRDGFTVASVRLDNLPETASEAKRNWKLFTSMTFTPNGIEVTYYHSAIAGGEEQAATIPFTDGATAHDFVVVAMPFEVEGSFTDEDGASGYNFRLVPCE